MNKKIGFVCSAFDLLHAGHILMLEDAKKQCDFLIVGLQTDPTLDRPFKNKPVQSIEERLIQIKAVKYVDLILIYDTEESLQKIIEALPINVRILGSDYKEKDFTGKEYHLNSGTEIYYHKRDHDYSSSKLRQKIAKLSG